jgi:signal transduction histidine kinase
MVGLESALTRPDADLRPALQDALSRTEHLSDTIQDLISLVRRPGFAGPPVDLGALLDDVGARWDTLLAARGRRLSRVTEPQLPRSLAPPAAVRQILDVLISNALWHGDGKVTIEAHAAGTQVAIDVSDQGDGLPTEPADLLAAAERADGHGRGLPLAHALAVAAGGSLMVRRAAPQPVFRLLLAAAGEQPAAHPAATTSKR